MKTSKLSYVNDGHFVPEVLFAALDNVESRPGIVGIQLPKWMGTEEVYELSAKLLFHFDMGDQNVVILPPPRKAWFDTSNPPQAEALARRVERDKTDGIRYNNVYIALYHAENSAPESVRLQHDFFIDIQPITGGGGNTAETYEMTEI